MAITSPPAVIEETLRDYTAVFSSGRVDEVSLRAEDTVDVREDVIVFTIVQPPEQIRWFLAHVEGLRVGTHTVTRAVVEPAEATAGRTTRGGLEQP